MTIDNKELSDNSKPTLFIQLDELERSNNNEYKFWKEKARWIRFQELAEEVEGRWSKPHITSLPYSCIQELKSLVSDASYVFDKEMNSINEIAYHISNEIIDYCEPSKAKKIAQMICLPHKHHHKKTITKTMSSQNIFKTVSTANFQDYDDVNEYGQNKLNSNEDFYSIIYYNENKKFKRKIPKKSEAASVLVMPIDFVSGTKLVFMRLKSATKLENLHEVTLATRFLVVIIGSVYDQAKLFEIGRAFSSCLADDICRDMFYSAKNVHDIDNIIDFYTKGTMLLPASEFDPKIRIEPPEKCLTKEERQKANDTYELLYEVRKNIDIHHEMSDQTLEFSKIPFNGLYKDIKRKLPFYYKDIKDSLHIQSVASCFYIYLVSICSLVAFGGILGKKTNNQMGTMECIFAGFLSGILFSLFSGQPLIIISATGPMLILETIVNDFCKKNLIDFMEFRLWIGIWTVVFLMVFVAFNLSFLVKYITPFTEDCFATLVAIIFIIDAVKNTLDLKNFKQLEYLPDNQTNSTLMNDYNESFYQLKLDLAKSDQQTSFYFSVILFLLTFFVCMGLKAFRDAPYFPSKVRELLGNFSVMIAIVAASVFDYFVGLKTQKLNIPSSFQPTLKGRSWIVPIYSGRNEWYTIFYAIIPALLGTILIFMDQQITAVIINKKEFKLKKSHGYHLDLLIIAIAIGLCSLLGLPWFVAATVLAMAHVNSLKMFSENTAPGEKPKFLGVREQRVTTIIMSALIGLSVFLTKILSYVPMCVLYGVFMFMGISSLNGMDFVERILIIFMPSKYQPDLPYLRYIVTKRVHFFTIIQLLCIIGLYVIKNITAIAITFPLFVLVTCIIRKLLDNVFTQEELNLLDHILPTNKYREEKPENFFQRLFTNKSYRKQNKNLEMSRPSNVYVVSEFDKTSKINETVNTNTHLRSNANKIGKTVSKEINQDEDTYVDLRLEQNNENVINLNQNYSNSAYIQDSNEDESKFVNVIPTQLQKNTEIKKEGEPKIATKKNRKKPRVNKPQNDLKEENYNMDDIDQDSFRETTKL